MKSNIASAGKVLSAGGWLLTLVAFGSLAVSSLKTRSSDPYDNLGDIGIGAQIGIGLITALLILIVAIAFILVAYVAGRMVDRRLLGWLFATAAPAIGILAFFIVA